MNDIRNAPRFPERRPVPLEEMRRLERAAYALENVSGAGTQADEAGLSVLTPRSAGFWLKVTGQYSISQPLYGGTEVYDAGGGAWEAVPGGVTVPNTGAYEITGNLKVPTDGSVIRWATPAASESDDWDFYAPAAAPATCLQFVQSVSCSGGTLTVVTKYLRLSDGSVTDTPC